MRYVSVSSVGHQLEKLDSRIEDVEPLCDARGIEHRLTMHVTASPQTDGMVEHFTGRITDVQTTHRLDSRSGPGRLRGLDTGFFPFDGSWRIRVAVFLQGESFELRRPVRSCDAGDVFAAKNWP